MKVWCVFQLPWFQPELLAIFSTEEKAQEFVKKMSDLSYKTDIEEWDLDES